MCVGVQDTRSLYLPTRLGRALIDPGKQLRLASAASAADALAVRSRLALGVVRCGGVELRGVKVSLTMRRPNVQAPPKLER